MLSGFAGVDGDLPVDVVPPPAASAQAFSVSGADTLAFARLATALRDIRDVGVEVIEASWPRAPATSSSSPTATRFPS